MRRTDLTVLPSAAVLLVIALSAPSASAQHREAAAQLQAMQAHEANLLERDLHRARLEVAERQRPARADTDSAWYNQLQDLGREFQQAHRVTSGAFSAPPQDSMYVAPSGTPSPPSYAQPPGRIGYGSGDAAHPGYWGVHPLCASPPEFHHRVALWRPPHFHPWPVTCSPRPGTHRHWWQARATVNLR